MTLPPALYNRLRFISEARKQFDSTPRWVRIPNRSSHRWMVVIALRLNGALRGGVSMRMRTPVDAWEEDVYGHLEVRLQGMNRPLRLNPIEWRPLRHHDNPPDAPPAHRNLRLYDRMHPFEINADYGLQGFDQSGPGIAVPLPRATTSFSDYAVLCSDVWRCVDLLDFPPPPWASTML